MGDVCDELSEENGTGAKGKAEGELGKGEKESKKCLRGIGIKQGNR